MNSAVAILACDRDTLFREALRNFLYAAGYNQVEVVPTIREALAKIRCERYRCIMIGLSRPRPNEQRLVALLRKRQPEAKVLFLMNANETAISKSAQADYVLKEHAFSTLSDWLRHIPNNNSMN